MKKLLLTLAVSVVLACAPAKADTIIFKHGTRLECKIIGLTPTGWKVILGNDSKASMIIDPATVEKIIYDYDSRLDAILQLEEQQGQPLWEKHYELGIWCEENAAYDRKMYNRALNRYLHCNRKKGIPHEVLLRLGRMYENITPSDPKSAIEKYREYLALHPDSVEAAEAIKRLEPEAAKNQPKASAVDGGAEGLETRTWRCERWGNPGTARSVNEQANGTTVLELIAQAGKEDKAAFSYSVNKDMSKKKNLVFDIYNPGNKPITIAVAVVTGAGFEWFESRSKKIVQETWNTSVTFDLTRADWKSKATNWVHRTKPENLNNVRSLTVLVFGAGTVYLDSVRFEDNE